MKTVCLYYFSGTGNTRKISHLVKDELESRGLDITLIPIDEHLKSAEPVHPEKYDLIGLAYPIYGFGTPELLFEFVKILPEGAGKNVFIFKTGADFISLNHNASHTLITELELKNYNVFYDRIIVMPSNWLVAYDDSMVRQLYLAAPGKVKHMCSELLQLKRRRFHTGAFMRIVSSGGARLEKNYGARYFTRSLRTDASCNLCGICVRNCPNGNINILNKGIVFNEECLWCMRCIYDCPRNSIYSRGLAFCILKGGYDIDKIINDDKIPGDFVTSETRGYFRHFKRYFDDESL